MFNQVVLETQITDKLNQYHQEANTQRHTKMNLLTKGYKKLESLFASLSQSGQLKGLSVKSFFDLVKQNKADSFSETGLEG